jgi:hypothetical protein
MAQAAAFVIAMLATPAGISGAALLPPFQVSALWTSPAATPTNLLYYAMALRITPRESGVPAWMLSSAGPYGRCHDRLIAVLCAARWGACRLRGRKLSRDPVGRPARAAAVLAGWLRRVLGHFIAVGQLARRPAGGSRPEPRARTGDDVTDARSPAGPAALPARSAAAQA